jgi:hypothetical protein
MDAMRMGLIISAIGAGLILFMLSLFWLTLFPGTSRWTPEKAEQWAKTKDRLHNLSFIVHSDQQPRRFPNKQAAQEEYERVKAAAERLRADFESAYDAPRTTANVLKWSGIALLAVGIVAHLGWKDSGG